MAHTISNYEQATFALVGDRPAIRRKVQSPTPWAMFNSDMVVRMTDMEMFNQNAEIIPVEDKDRVRLLDHIEELQRVIRRRNEENSQLKDLVEKMHHEQEKLKKEVEIDKIEAVLGDLAVVDEHNGSRDDNRLAARRLHNRGVRVVKP